MKPSRSTKFHPQTTGKMFGIICMVTAVFLSASSLHGAEKWLLPDADFRVRWDMTEAPSDPVAGVVAIFQNGGMPAQPAALSIVYDSSGKELKSECLWNNPTEGMAIVFEPPSARGPVNIYLKKSSNVRRWTPQSIFKPGLLLYTEPGKHNLNDVRTFVSKIPPGSNARMGVVPMVADRANRFGISPDYISYYCGWLNVPTDAPVYFCTISSDGSQALIDGKIVAEWLGEHPYKENTPGEHGKSSAVGKGPHRFEYLHYCVTGTPQAQFVWKLPGGAEKFATPQGKDFLRSGTGKVTAVETQTGAPVAWFDAPAIYYAEYDGEVVDLFELKLPFLKSPNDVEVMWEFGNKGKVVAPKVCWPLLRGEQLMAKLSVKSAAGQTSSARPLHADGVPKPTNIGSRQVREHWQEALLTQIRASAAPEKAIASWPKCFWSMLPDIIEPGEGKELLEELFEHGYDAIIKLPVDAREKLENVYIENIAGDHDRAAAFLTKTIATQKDPAYLLHWQLIQIDFYLNEVGDIKEARRLSEALRLPTNGISPTARTLRMVQIGDIERLDGNADKAVQRYGEARQEYQKLTAPTPPPLGKLMDRPTPTPTPKQNEKGIVIETAKGAQTDWRARTVRQNAYFTEVGNLLDQGYIAEAKSKLDEWVVEFPFSKLDGNFALAEGRYYSMLGNKARAVRILSAYRKQTEISNELPAIMDLEIRCLVSLKKNDEIVELAEDIYKRFPDLPIAKYADEVLKSQKLPPLKDGKKLKKHKSDS